MINLTNWGGAPVQIIYDNFRFMCSQPDWASNPGRIFATFHIVWCLYNGYPMICQPSARSSQPGFFVRKTSPGESDNLGDQTALSLQTRGSNRFVRPGFFLKTIQDNNQQTVLPTLTLAHPWGIEQRCMICIDIIYAGWKKAFLRD